MGVATLQATTCQVVPQEDALSHSSKREVPLAFQLLVDLLTMREAPQVEQGAVSEQSMVHSLDEYPACSLQEKAEQASPC